MSSRQRLASAVLLVSLLALPLSAAGQARIAWSAPAECPTRAEAAAEIARLAQADLRTFSSELSASVEITRSSSEALRARVAVHAGGRTREHVLADASCVALARAAALVIALAFEPAAATTGRRRKAPSSPVPPPGPSSADAQETPSRAREQAPSPEPQGTPSPQPEPTPGPTPQPSPNPPPQQELEPAATAQAPEPPAAAPAPPPVEDSGLDIERPAPSAPSQPLEAFVGAAFGLLQGTLPKLAPFGALSVGLMSHDFYAALRLGYAPSQAARLASPEGTGGRVSLANAALEGGLRLQASPIEIPILAGFEAGVFIARGFGPMTQAETRVAGWLASYLSTGFAVTLAERWRLGMRLDGVLALRRPSFALDTDTGARSVFHRPSMFGLRGYVAFELRWR